MSLIFQKFAITIIFNLDLMFTNLITADPRGLTNDNTNVKCQIPNHKPHTHYKVLTMNGVNNLKPGEDVPATTAVEIVCDKGYQKIPSPYSFSLCYHNGTWSYPLSNCSRSCPSLKSTTSTTVTCYYNNRILDNCNNPVKGTVVQKTCNSLYYEHNVNTLPKHYCQYGKWSPSIHSCEPRCGKKRAEGVPTIIGGQDAVSGTYPWQVAVYGDQKNFICGGSIIKPHVVLSAAHCFTQRNGIRIPSEKYTLAGGKYYSKYDDDRDFNAQFRKISKIYIPDGYKPDYTYHSNDIAVLILTDPFNLTVNVHLVCIELNRETIPLYSSNNNEGIVTGWGKVGEGKEISSVLKELKIPIISYQDCYDRVPHGFQQFITDDQICGGYLNQSTGVCGGDSGGGLVVKDYADQYYIKGIVSVSPRTPEFQCDSNQYSLFTSVRTHIDYIQDILIQNQQIESIETLEEFDPNDQFNHVNYTTSNQPFLESNCSETEKGKPRSEKCALKCPSLTSSSSTNIKCQYYGNPVANCMNPMEGTKALFSCKKYHEEPSLLINPILSCAEGKWNSSIPQCYPICGDSNDMYSWHVGIYNKSKEFVCGGSIITTKIILSAAQCFTDINGKMEPAENYLVAAGKHFREYSDYRDVDAQYSMITQIHIPTAYRGRIAHNLADIAILILSKALLLSKAVQPICFDQKETSRNLDTSIYHDVMGEIVVDYGLGLYKKNKENFRCTRGN